MTTSIDSLTRDETLSRMEELRDRGKELAAKHRTSKADDLEFSEGIAEFSELQRHYEALERDEALERAERAETARAIAGAVGGGSATLRLDRGVDPYAGRDAAAELRHSGQRDSALRQLERSVKGGLPAAGAEAVEQLLTTGTELETSWVSRWVCDTGAPSYRSAFAKLVMFGESRAALEWTAAERAAYDRVARLRSEQRAMSLTDSSGGFLVPFELDPTIILTSAGSTNPLMQIANVKTVTTDVWHGVTSAGVQFSWDAEASEVSDDSPALAEPSIPNYKLQGWVPFSVELQGDAVALVGEIGKLLSDGATQILNDALTVGSGTGCPTGIVVALSGTSSVVNTGTADVLAAADVYALQSSLAPRWQANARWCFNLATLNALRQMETGNGALKFPGLQNDQPVLLGRPVHELSNMDGTIDTGQDNAIGLYGDFSNYVVTQRVGTTVELVPHIFGPNRRPTGQRGMLMWARYGADSVNDTAFRLLVA